MSTYKTLRIPLNFQKINESIVKYGLFKSFRIAYGRFYDIRFDRKHGIDTVGLARLENIDVGLAGQKIGNQYQPSGILNTRKVLKHLKKYKKTGFVDFGSGKGQVLLEAMNFGYNPVYGVEFSKDLCTIADINVIKYTKGKSFKSLPKSVCIDAAQFEIPKEIDLIYFFDPFKEQLLEKVLQNIVESHNKYPREIVIAYCLPRSNDLFKKYFTYIENFALDEYECEIYKLTMPN